MLAVMTRHLVNLNSIAGDGIPSQERVGLKQFRRRLVLDAEEVQLPGKRLQSIAAGINFSMRSVLVTDTRYKAGNFERHVEPDELLQMFGRAGRRGLDEVGYVLVLPDIPRLGDARPRKLKRKSR